MSFALEVKRLSYSVSKKPILKDIEFRVPTGSFVAILGENGAGKTSLLDLAMGFRKPTSGEILLEGKTPHLDPWQLRAHVAYLSEKMDLPGYWTAGEFLEFHRHFYPNYSLEREKELVKELRIDMASRVGSLSAGEVRRTQIVAALSSRPRLILIDEITAVLDIVGRQKLLNLLRHLNQTDGCTVLLATNILEDLVENISHLCLLSHGSLRTMLTIEEFLNGGNKAIFSRRVVDELEAA